MLKCSQVQSTTPILPIQSSQQQLNQNGGDDPMQGQIMIKPQPTQTTNKQIYNAGATGRLDALASAAVLQATSHIKQESSNQQIPQSQQSSTSNSNVYSINASQQQQQQSAPGSATTSASITRRIIRQKQRAEATWEDVS